MRRLTIAALIVCLAPIAARGADEAEAYSNVLTLLTAQKLDAAEAALRLARQQFPQSGRLGYLHAQFAIAHAARSDRAGAVQHAEAYVDSQLQFALAESEKAGPVVDAIKYMLTVCDRVDGAAPIELKLDVALDQISAHARRQPSADYDLAIVELRGLKAERAASKEAALAQVEAMISLSEEAFRSQSNAPRALQLATAYGAQSSVLRRFSPDEADAAERRRLAFLGEQVAKHPDDWRLAGEYLDTVVRYAQSQLERDAQQAEATIKRARELAALLKTSDASEKNRIRSAERSFERILSRIEELKARNALVGQPAFPLQVDAWVGGDPLTDGDLQGKVVLLDFWAVWCGPCIATFPHLRRWHDRHSDDGLVIIGATRYDQFDWNDQAKRSEPAQGLPKAKELEAKQQFAAHHQVQHRLMIVPEQSDFHEKYRVAAIPQAVLIDRQGVIRLLRVGHSPQNIHDLERMIEMLINEGRSGAGD